jgi:hypothetical protein
MVMYVSMLRVWWYGMRQAYEMKEVMRNEQETSIPIPTYIPYHSNPSTPIKPTHSLDLCPMYESILCLMILIDDKWGFG